MDKEIVDDELKIVDELFDAMFSTNADVIIKLAGIDRNDIKYFNIEIFDLVEIALKKITSVMTLKQREYLMTFIDGPFQKNCIYILEKSNGFTNEIESMLDREDLEYKFFRDEYDDLKQIYDLISLVCATGDIDYIKRFMDKYYSELSDFELTNLLESINDEKFIEECIMENSLAPGSGNLSIRLPNKSGKFLSNCNFIRLLKKINNQKFILDLLTDSQGISKKYKSSDIVEMMKLTKDFSLIKNSIESGMINEIILEPEDISSLIMSVQDKDYIISCIERAKELKILKVNPTNDKKIRDENSYNLVTMILATHDLEYIKSCIKRDDLELENEGRLLLAIAIKDNDYLSKNIPNLVKGDVIDLPEDMTIGIEIESLGIFGEEIRHLSSLFGWECKKDTSISNFNFHEYKKRGVEVVSPVLSGNNLTTTNSINNITNLLQALGEKPNYSCGGHIHIGADYLNTPEAMNNFLEIILNCEGILYLIGNKVGEAPRNAAESNAKQISPKFAKMIADGSYNTKNITTIDELKNYIAIKNNDRFQSINFLNMARGGRGTIEFRIPNGSVEASTWIQNINLFGGIVAVSRELAEIKARIPDITLEEQEKLEVFNKLVSDKEDGKPRSSEEKLELLLKLAIKNESKRDIYRERFNKNFSLIKGKSKFEYIAALLEQNSIHVTTNDIAKVSLIGDKAPGLEDIEKVADIVSSEHIIDVNNPSV